MLNKLNAVTVWFTLALLGATTLAPGRLGAQAKSSEKTSEKSSEKAPEKGAEKPAEKDQEKAQDQEGLRKVTKKVAPVYPPLAKQGRLTGAVKMTVVVSPEGDVKSVRTVGGNPILAAAAEEAVKQWKFEAAKNESTEHVTLRFAAAE